MEIWTTGIAHVSIAARAAARAEAHGYDGMLVVDSQNLAGDPFVGMALAAAATERLKLGTGVTNPATRHPVATAAAIASVHLASAGRACLGVGRGDSALAYLGLAPASVDELERFARIVRKYLRREPVDFAELVPYERAGARSIDVMGLADRPADSRLQWLPSDLPPVPVEVVGTGPRALAAAGRVADRVLLAVGADPDRVSWAAGVARSAGEDRSDGGPSVGAFVNVVCHPDVERGRELGAGGVTTFARFSAMDGKVRAPIDGDSSRVLHEVHDAYDMHQHTRSGSPQSHHLTPEFVDRFAVIGPPDHCIERLRALAEVGVSKFVVVGPSMDADREEARRASELFAREVLPVVQA